MKKKLLGLVACMALFGVSQAGATTYDLIPQTTPPLFGPDHVPLSVTGTITTDGNTGILSQADIIDWNLTVSGDGAPVLLTAVNSDFPLFGNDLTATPTQLNFNYADTLPGNASEIIVGNSCTPYPCGAVEWISGAFNSNSSTQGELFLTFRPGLDCPRPSS
jgi:hypothetical protein